ncbi:aldehyde dehydrogenase family protein [Bacillus sp. S3]|uniref:aldehyde dehydrogenase family protein n=1 Tax=Bacillus sp. S3 TaxID=486398 RepID=UPI0011877521|nr:aldehyde dehydrogenase family protein [Bacillus sp. S3]QCJ45216.1 aldehyde dehydrogenase family protein [Bacillus sp. S3]
MYIDGEWQFGSSGKTRVIKNPATEEVIATVTEGAAEDVCRAVEAAHRAFYERGWMASKARDRAAILYQLADRLEEKIEEFALLETLNNGKSIHDSIYDINDAVNQFRFYAGLATKPHGQVYDVPDEIQAMVIAEPIGVVGQIVPWNYPLLMATQKIAPALAAGCTVVIKPAEQTPLTLIRLFELIDEIGFPNGVINLVLGAGSVVGAELSSNPLVDKISFTGGTATGKIIMKTAADTIKKVSLELGGKSPLIVFEDADFETAVDYASFAIFANQGQVCSAGSRLLLQQSIYEKFVTELVKKAKAIKIGPGIDESTDMGPLISEVQLNRVLGYIDIGIKEGARVLCGGNKLNRQGYFIEPTIFTDTTPEMRIVQEEIFGPVLVIQKFKTEEEAIRLANGTNYGLAGGVFTTDSARAMRVIRKLRAGITWINTYHNTFNEAPWGGYKQSGIGRDLGTYGFQEYLEMKQVNINLDIKPIGWLKAENK